MEQQEAKALLGIIGLGACCGSCAKGGPCDGLGADRFVPKVSAATSSVAYSPRTPSSPTVSEPLPSRPLSPYSTATPSQQTAGGTLNRMLKEEALPSQARAGLDYQWATLNQDVWIGGHKFTAGTRIVVSVSQTSSSGGGKAHTTSIVTKVWAKFGQSFDSSSWVEGAIGASLFTLTGQSATWGSQGFGAPPHMGGGGGGMHGGGGHHGGGGGFHRGGFRRGGFRRGGFGPWWGGPEVIVVEQTGCEWTGPLPASTMPSRALAALQVAPKQALAEGSTWQQAYIPVIEGGDFDRYGHGWYGKHTLVNGGVEFYVCTFTGPGLYGLGAVTSGDYHIVGTNVTLRARPEAGSQPIATLQNGEGVFVFGDTETDAANMVGPNGTAIPNDGSSPGIEYARIGTQTHGAGFVAMRFIAQGAGGAVGQQQPAPAPSPSPALTPESGKMGLVSKVLLGGAIGATIAAGGLLIWTAVKDARPRRLAHA